LSQAEFLYPLPARHSIKAAAFDEMSVISYKKLSDFPILSVAWVFYSSGKKNNPNFRTQIKKPG